MACGTGCGSGCGKSCSGAMENYCPSNGCSGSCHFSCSGGCSGGCYMGCTGDCTGCRGCSGGCTGCDGCSGCDRGCAGACSSTDSYAIRAVQFNDIAYSRDKSARVTAGNNINASDYNKLSSGMSAGTTVEKKNAKEMAGWTVSLP